MINFINKKSLMVLKKRIEILEKDVYKQIEKRIEDYHAWQSISYLNPKYNVYQNNYKLQQKRVEKGEQRLNNWYLLLNRFKRIETAFQDNSILRVSCLDENCYQNLLNYYQWCQQFLEVILQYDFLNDLLLSENANLYLEQIALALEDATFVKPLNTSLQDVVISNDSYCVYCSYNSILDILVDCLVKNYSYDTYCYLISIYLTFQNMKLEADKYIKAQKEEMKKYDNDLEMYCVLQLKKDSKTIGAFANEDLLYTKKLLFDEALKMNQNYEVQNQDLQLILLINQTLHN